MNIGKGDVLPLSPIEMYFGAYIDNIFVITPDNKLARKVHHEFGAELVRSGLVLSEESEHRERRKLLGLRAEGDGELPGLKAPEEVDEEMYSMSQRTYSTFDLLERQMGKISWLCSLDRLFFCLFVAGDRLVARLWARNANPRDRIRLSREVRREFENFSICFRACVLACSVSPARRSSRLIRP